MSGPPRRLFAVVAVLLIATLVLGTATATGMFGPPAVVASESRLVGATESTTTVESTLTVHNPNPFPITVQQVDLAHTVLLNGIQVGSGEQTGVSLPSGNSTTTIQTELGNENVTDWWPSHVRRGERSNLTVRTTLSTDTIDGSVSRRVASRTVRTDMLGAFETDETVPITHPEFPGGGPALYVNETSATWGAVSENRTVVRMRLRVYNPTEYSIPVRGVDYTVGMNDIAVADGSTANTTAIPPETGRTVPARLVIDNDRLDDWWPTHVRRNQTTTVSVDYAVRLDLSAYGAPNRTVSPDPLTRRFHTELFAGNATAKNGFVSQSSASSSRSMISVLPT